MQDNIVMRIPGKPEYISAVRLAMGAIAAGAGFDVLETEDIKTAVGEACQLITCHALEGYASVYTVKCDVEKGRIGITVTKSGNEFIPRGERRCLNCPDEGEIGKFMISALMDEVEIDCSTDDSRTISMVKLAKKA
ncbi:MAG: ATP-binding protein [Firmicutes bacterium]|nr:ATP-binding protein [Bacillota bacterium]